MNEKTYAQNARQRRRTSAGRYEKMYECDLCGRPLGEDYCSDLRVDSDVIMPDGSIYHWGDMGICLCARCCKKLNKMSNLEAYEALAGEPYPLAIDYSADSDSGDASRITPDPAGEDKTADDGRPMDVLRMAHTYRAIMRRLYGTYSAQAQRAAAVFDNLFAVRDVKFA